MPPAAAVAVVGGAAAAAAAAVAAPVGAGGRGGARPPWAERCSSAPAECFPCWGSRTQPSRTEEEQKNNLLINLKFYKFNKLIYCK